MITQFRFFDTTTWSIFATLQTILILLIFRLGFDINKLKILVLASLLAMMQGKLPARVIFAFFLSLMVWDKDEFFKGIIFTLIATVVAAYIPYYNSVHQLFLRNKILKNIMFLSIIFWFIYMIYLIFNKLF